MVCLGNICRSPLAQGIMEHKARLRGLEWMVDSAGTSRWHIGEPPDPRSIKTARKYGIDISAQRARQILMEDADRFDLILPMDQNNYSDIKRMLGQKFDEDKIKLILNFVNPGTNTPVPDPYYDGSFEKVFRLLDQACDHLLDHYVKN